MNVQIMLQDSARIIDEKSDTDDGSAGEVIHRELKTKEDIKNHLKGLI